MNTFLRRLLPLCFSLIVVYTIMGTAAADSQPTANFITNSGQNPLNPLNPLTIQVTDKSSNADYVYFDFGDGSNLGPYPVGTSVTHTYAKPGSYTIEEDASKEVVTDPMGYVAVSTCTQTVYVGGLPPDTKIRLFAVSYGSKIIT
jgi:PKD domain